MSCVSPYNGVSYDKDNNVWYSTYETTILGSFSSQLQAALSFDEAARKSLRSEEAEKITNFTVDGAPNPNQRFCEVMINTIKKRIHHVEEDLDHQDNSFLRGMKKMKNVFSDVLSSIRNIKSLRDENQNRKIKDVKKNHVLIKRQENFVETSTTTMWIASISRKKWKTLTKMRRANLLM